MHYWPDSQTEVEGVAIIGWKARWADGIYWKYGDRDVMYIIVKKAECSIGTKARWQYEVEGVLLERSQSVSQCCTIGKV